MPDQIEVLKMLLEYRKKYGPIRDEGVENLADYIASELRAWLMDREDEQP